MHLSYQRWKGEPAGRWLLRRYIGNRKYRTTALGFADDDAKADGARVLSYKQAEAKARAMVETPNGKIERPCARRSIATSSTSAPSSAAARRISYRAWVIGRGGIGHRAAAQMARHHGSGAGTESTERQ